MTPVPESQRDTPPTATSCQVQLVQRGEMRAPQTPTFSLLHVQRNALQH